MKTNPNVAIQDSTISSCGVLEKYIMVGWPEIQDFMEHPRFEECIFCCTTEGHPCPDNTYMVPEFLFKEVYENKITL